MEMMPYQPHLDSPTPGPGEMPPPLGCGAPAADERSDWRLGLPVLEGAQLTLRELEIEDAPALFAELTTEEVARFISPPPASVEGFERFINWAHKQRAAGKYACFAVVPEGQTTAVGMFQIRMLDVDEQVAEWGFAIGSAYWGTGLFPAGAELALEFAFTDMDVRRLEARSAIPNGRGNGALRKVGAVRETVLEKSFERHGELLDQALWVITRAHWARDRDPHGLYALNSSAAMPIATVWGADLPSATFSRKNWRPTAPTSLAAGLPPAPRHRTRTPSSSLRRF